jgi:DNA-binding NarL/FixJ family response regulator
MTTQSQIRVVVADDQTAERDGLELLLGLLDDVRVVGSAADGVEAVRLAIEHDADVVLMDLRLRGDDGVTVTARIRAAHPRTQVVVLTMPGGDVDAARALQAGAFGHLPKDAGRKQIAGAIRAAVSGGTAPVPPVDPSARLTRREVEVLGLIADGMSNRQIATHLYVSEATVKSHINRVFAKTGARDRAGAVAYARSHGIGSDQGVPAQ